MKWINVKDRKPEKDQIVLCLLENRDMYVLKYCICYDRIYRFLPLTPYDDHYCTLEELENVIYWMPLPEPPKEMYEIN